MKNLIFLLTLSSFTLYLTSCEKADVVQSNESEHAKHEQLGIRADNCNYCPANDCCCYVELNGGSIANLIFCGTTNPDISTNVCGPIDLDGCPDISGFEWFEQLNTGDPNEFFCVPIGGSFMIGVGSPGGNIRFTCQYGQLNPQFVNLNLTSGEKKYYTVTDGCVLNECHLE